MNRENESTGEIDMVITPQDGAMVVETARDYCNVASGREGKVDPFTHLVARRIVASALEGRPLTASVASINQMTYGIETLS